MLKYGTEKAPSMLVLSTSWFLWKCLFCVLGKWQLESTRSNMLKYGIEKAPSILVLSKSWFLWKCLFFVFWMGRCSPSMSCNFFSNIFLFSNSADYERSDVRLGWAGIFFRSLFCIQTLRFWKDQMHTFLVLLSIRSTLKIDFRRSGRRLGGQIGGHPPFWRGFFGQKWLKIQCLHVSGGSPPA